MKIGDIVTVLSPFNVAYPVEYTIINTLDDPEKTCVLDNEAEFAPHWLQLVSSI